MNKLYHLQIMEYCTELINELRICISTWMNLTKMILRKRSIVKYICQMSLDKVKKMKIKQYCLEIDHLW